MPQPTNDAKATGTDQKPWLKYYRKDMKNAVDFGDFKNILNPFDLAVRKFRQRPCFTNMGTTLTYADLDRRSGEFASFLQNELGLKKGDRFGIQLPNLLQYPVVLFAALRIGLVVVNTNPLYTCKEMLHQFTDSGVKAVIILANFAHNLESILKETKIESVIVTEVGDELPFPKNWVINLGAKYLKKMVPPYHIAKAYTYAQAMQLGAKNAYKEVKIDRDDLAFLQYTGGTTGVSKGAMLTHGNILANLLQIGDWMRGTLKEEGEIILTPLPLYHIFSLTVNCLTLMTYGIHNVLITNPRDFDGFIKEMKKHKFTVMTGVNTLFNALMNHKDFTSVDFSTLKLSVAGGMALQTSVGERWKKLTKSTVFEGYGLSETSPVLCVNPVWGNERSGTIGIPVPGTEVVLLDDDNQPVAMGQEGEIAGKGPQVMSGYWKRDDETALAFHDGWFKTGDIAVELEGGFFKIVDRKKDMILVSGFNVYPNEVEDAIASHPGVAEVAAIGVHDERSGEVVKVFVVRKDPNLTQAQVIEHARKSLTGYKVPHYVEFRNDLPKTNVGKILRRALRDAKT